jgi:hypothetical protein
MLTFLVKTKAVMEQSYKIEAPSKEEAEKIALENTQDIIEQTQVDAGEVLSVEEV